jgi:hypothetical protein
MINNPYKDALEAAHQQIDALKVELKPHIPQPAKAERDLGAGVFFPIIISCFAVSGMFYYSCNLDKNEKQERADKVAVEHSIAVLQARYLANCKERCPLETIAVRVDTNEPQTEPPTAKCMCSTREDTFWNNVLLSDLDKPVPPIRSVHEKLRPRGSESR